MTDHSPDEWLKLYSEGGLREPRLGQVEEHLLICERCRGRLTTFDQQQRGGGGEALEG